MSRRVVILGPTAAGKSDIALRIAARLDAEIVGADSRQIYRGLEIGTAAPSAEDRARVPHHMASFLDPGVAYSAGRYAREARAILDDLQVRGRRALIVGGSGLYLRALLTGLFRGPERDDALREILQGRLATEGLESLRKELRLVDPETYGRVLPGDAVRVIRALEVHALTGTPISALRRDQAGRPLDAVRVGIRWSRRLLARRIDARIHEQLRRGFLDEARALLRRNDPADAPGPSTLGYRELLAHLRGETSLSEAVQRIALRTRQLAKRQETWFRREEGVVWFEVATEAELDAVGDSIVARAAEVRQRGFGEGEVAP